MTRSSNPPRSAAAAKNLVTAARIKAKIEEEKARLRAERKAAKGAEPKIRKTPGPRPGAVSATTAVQIANLNTIMGAMIDELGRERAEKLSAIEWLELCLIVASRANQFHVLVSMAEKVAPYRTPKAVASVVDQKGAKTWTVLGGLPEPTPPPPDPTSPGSTTIQ